VCLVAMITLNIKLSGIYFLLLALSYILFRSTSFQRSNGIRQLDQY
jgi:hypothetical protein